MQMDFCLLKQKRQSFFIQLRKQGSQIRFQFLYSSISSCHNVIISVRLRNVLHEKKKFSKIEAERIYYMEETGTFPQLTGTSKSQYQTMTQTPVPRLITRLAVPTVVSMLVSSLYNMADTFFVARIGTSAGAAVGVVFSAMAVIQAVGFTVGMGSGSILSRLLGQQNTEAGNRVVSVGFFMAVFLGLCIAVPGLLFLDPFMLFLGSTETILPFAKSYAVWILTGAPLMCGSFFLNNILRAEGRAAFSMIGLTAGGFLNILLDPLLIFGFGMGTAGAGAATLVSQAVSFCILLQFFLRKKSASRISVRCFPPARDVFPQAGRIIANGFPSLCRQGLSSISVVMLNRRAALYGDAVVAGFAVVLRITMFVASVMIGIGQGFTPVAGFNYGAGKYSRVRAAYRFTLKSGFLLLAAASAVLFLFAPQVIAVFSGQREVVAAGTAILRWQCAALPFHAGIVTTNMLMQATGKTVTAAFLSSNRQGSFFLPLVLVLPAVFGLRGLEAVQGVSDFLSFLAAIPFAVSFLRKLKQKEDRN